MTDRYDVIVVGAGNAAFCAALAAKEHAGRVLILDKAPADRTGGNSFFTAGAFRVAYGSLETIRPLLDDLSDEQAARIDLPPYTERDFTDDMRRLTHGRCDPELTAILVGNSLATVGWMRDRGVRWELMYARQSHRVGDRIRFWGGLALGVVGGGEGLIEAHTAAARARNVEIRYATPAVALEQDPSGRVAGVVVRHDGGRETIAAGAVVLACGGFEADPRMRASYLGPNWDIARVRGTPFNTGDGLRMALDAGAKPYGHWSGCHAVFWDAGAPPSGDWELTNRLSKLSYPIGILVNAEARRFLDEGADFRNYTYAQYGAEVLRQPGAIAYQLFDARTEPLLREDEYRAPGATRVEADSIEELAAKLGLSPATLAQTVREFNAAVQPGPFDPSIRDGKRTVGLDPPKSNWSLPLDTPPFVCFPVTCGITFTFGGVRIDAEGRVLDAADRPIPGLHAAGELVGGLFYHNYPGGTGLTAGAVFGRRAGAAAGREARARQEGA
ncbi:MAG TPA: FAD-dependent tricarballylate dehydrogenase TcuA [Chloroflexota bacterium]|nr:FAD-dependent tricarballylate dehydrogenase TcuA [Chloroflexota bacterium]